MRRERGREREREREKERKRKREHIDENRADRSVERAIDGLE